MNMVEDGIDRIRATYELLGIAPSTLYNWIARGLWVRPIKIGGRAAGIPRRENRILLDARISGKSEAEIKKLVKDLEAARGGQAVA